MTNAREEILEKLEKASSTNHLLDKPDFDSSVYFPVDGDLLSAFKKNIELINGNVRIFDSEKHLYQSLEQQIDSKGWETISCFESEIKKNLSEFNISFNSDSEIPENIDAGITGCEYLIAHLGSAVVSSAQEGGRKMFVYPPIHIIIAYEDQLVDYLDTAYRRILKKYNNNIPSMISVITGPSRTADIEKTLVLGAHGPKELYIYIVKNDQ